MKKMFSHTKKRNSIPSRFVVSNFWYCCCRSWYINNSSLRVTPWWFPINLQKSFFEILHPGILWYSQKINFNYPTIAQAHLAICNSSLFLPESTLDNFTHKCLIHETDNFFWFMRLFIIDGCLFFGCFGVWIIMFLFLLRLSLFSYAMVFLWTIIFI